MDALIKSLRPGKPSDVKPSEVKSPDVAEIARQYSLSVTKYKSIKAAHSDIEKAFVRQAIESGRLRREEDAVKEALLLWEERERARAEILAAVDEAETSLARGEGRIITQESMHELAEDVKRRGRTRLAAEQQTPR